MKVAIFTPSQSGQRVNYYNELGRLVDLTVISEREFYDSLDIVFGVKVENYKTKYMHGIKCFKYMAFCPEVIKVLKNNHFDIIILKIIILLRVKNTIHKIWHNQYLIF
ncbi:MAG: hypothetical protein Q4F88_05980 [Eubacteriales bacterium]|nr:hypothetical protein [Eubacteriales bacterium]